ncbi:hypothetical protein LNP04_05150 [Chryseobacterium sp. C-71]|uniref:hypothetical protein n=1 Tax=Chryseobacterium sp. C-71 TaxID=2893882 RepID=UPI001E2CEA34|nr:hypothetical protein [Chryseobacterium sp. C-71]UFH33110.1 hypothetical protein LNP04_05150 [Chryseobacterium sp. C-71]
MESINVKVAFCTECKGYYAATPTKKEDCNHPEIIDHYFYHGEPYFTLNQRSFESNTQLSNTEVRILKLSDHQANDHQHCNCVKDIVQRKKIASKSEYNESKLITSTENSEMEADVYFTDLYCTYNNFHGINTSVGRSASA